MKRIFSYGVWVGFCVFTVVSILAGMWIYNALQEKYLRVVFLDIGQGDAIFIEAPNGNQVLMDAGTGSQIIPQLQETMGLFDRSIDILIETHPDMDHIGGFIPVLDQYRVGAYAHPSIIADTQIYARLQEKLQEKETPLHHIERGVRIHLDRKSGVYLDILHPYQEILDHDDRNAASIVARLVYGGTSFMLTGDAIVENEIEIINTIPHTYIQSDILKLGHHGSRTSTSREFLSVVDPYVGIISAGYNNRYGHPHQEVLDNLHFFNIPYRATYEDGNIAYTSDGEYLFFEQ